MGKTKLHTLATASIKRAMYMLLSQTKQEFQLMGTQVILYMNKLLVSFINYNNSCGKFNQTNLLHE